MGEGADVAIDHLANVLAWRARENCLRALRYVIVGSLALTLVLAMDRPEVVQLISRFAAKGLVNPSLSWIHPTKWILSCSSALFLCLALIMAVASWRHMREARSLEGALDGSY